MSTNGIKNNNKKEVWGKSPCEIIKDIEYRKRMLLKELERHFELTRPNRRGILRGIFTDICE